MARFKPALDPNNVLNPEKWAYSRCSTSLISLTLSAKVPCAVNLKVFFSWYSYLGGL